MDKKLSLAPPASESPSKSASETELASYSNATEAGRPKKRSFLSAVFSRGRRRSVDGRVGELSTAAPPQVEELAPPPYESAAPKQSSSSSQDNSAHYLHKPNGKETEESEEETEEDGLAVLRDYDTVILVDDSGSMRRRGTSKASRWEEAGKALQALADVAKDYDADGIDIHFLNHIKPSLNMKSSTDVKAAFRKISPTGGTPTGYRLDQLLRPRLVELENAIIREDGTPIDPTTEAKIKPVNFIVITDGEPSDSPKDFIIDAAKRLKAIRNLSLVQIGIQFVQVGDDERATQALKELDDDLENIDGIRDIVDTTPYSEMKSFTGDGLIKVLLGGINRRLDRIVLKD
ncbi:hypothetical protein B0H15DRAFT_866232 [Mycena belliarum]|uniref:VWFA domain-containing protein n=1 Tax=Mycena belliarum TaxID=1033014 RepID=A0AAD6TPL2_9AGAR|nr:hypothetical protein B0H15DRAFT_866232 [Mycena belliae]